MFSCVNIKRMNPEQQTAFDACYTQLKQNISSLIESYKANSASQIIFHTILVTMIVKQVESSGLKGVDKKVIAIELGHKLIIEIVADPNTEAAVLGVYDMFASNFIDQLVDVASNVNVRVTHELLDKKPKACCVLM